MNQDIDLKKLIEQLGKGKIRDYSFLTIFFIVFSIFVYFAIRPSLITAFSLKKEEADLKKLDSNYEQTISSVVSNQAAIEEIRDKLPLLSSALPERPKINMILSDIENVGKENSVIVEQISVNKTNLLVKSSKSAQSLTVNIQASSTFDDLLKFIQSLSNQRRLKTIRTINISSQNKSSTQSGQLNIDLEIESFFL